MSVSSQITVGYVYNLFNIVGLYRLQWWMQFVETNGRVHFDLSFVFSDRWFLKGWDQMFTIHLPVFGS